MSDERVLQDTSATAGLRAQVALPTPVAIWVLAAHAIALLTPLLLLWAVYANWVFVSALAAAPGIFYVAVAFMMAASAFEIAQNTADRWYLEPGMGSTDGTALSDCLPADCRQPTYLVFLCAAAQDTRPVPARMCCAGQHCRHMGGRLGGLQRRRG